MDQMLGKKKKYVLEWYFPLGSLEISVGFLLPLTEGLLTYLT